MSASVEAGRSVESTVGPSSTAIMTAIARGQHRLQDRPPWVFDDPYALALAGPAWPQVYGMASSLLPEPVMREAMGLVLGRSRYAEDRLTTGSFAQFVVLGSGLDSFAWRRPDLLHSLHLFEVDQPATLDWKRERAAALALPTSDRHVYVAADLQRQSLREALAAARFDWSVPTLFSWLGVTIYLSVPAIEATLRTVAGCSPGSEVVLSYSPPDQQLDAIGVQLRTTMAPVAAAGGEVFRTLLSPQEVEGLVSTTGLEVVDHPTREELHERYFARHSRGLTFPSSERLVTATVRHASARVG